MNKQVKHILLGAIAATGMTVTSAQAQNPGFAYGDLLLGFQTTSGTSYLLANLGASQTARDATSTFTLGGNLGTALTTAFGANWFNRTDLYIGVFTVGSNDEFDATWGAGTGGVNGDPYNTLYIGIPRQSNGANAQVTGVANSNAPMMEGGNVQNAANAMADAAISMEMNGTGAVSTISNTAQFQTFVDYNDSNTFDSFGQVNSWNGEFSGGTQAQFGAGTFGTLGGVAAEAALDLYRVQGVNNEAGQVGFGQPVGRGTYEGTVVIDNAGNVSLVVVPEPASLGLLSLGAGMLGFIRRRRSA